VAKGSKEGERCVQASCGKRLSPKGKKYSREGGHICDPCYKNNRGKGKKLLLASTPPSTPLRQQRQPCVPPPSLLSPDQRAQLHSTVKAAGIGQQGRSRSAEENARAILHVDTMMTAAAAAAAASSSVVRTLSYDAVVKAVAKAEFTTPNTLRQTHQRYVREGELTPPEPKRIKRDDPHHMLFDEGGPSLEAQAVIHELMKDAAEMNIYASIRTIRAEVFAATGIEVPKTTMHTWLHDMDFEHGEKKLTGLKASYAHATIRRYILEYSAVLKEEERGNVVLVWMDESYIHTGYCSKYSWFHRDNDVVANRVRGSESGKRLIIIHAMTKDGMLEMPDIDPSDNLNEQYASASVVSAKLSAEGFEPEDYHDTLNGEKFLQWVRNRLIPAFQAKYKRKKMVLILDNAKYHHARGIEWVYANKMTKPALGNFLRLAKVKSIKLPGGRVIKADKFTADAGSGGPTVPDLREVVRDYIRSHPAINTTLVHQAMQPHKYQLLYTPPYESWIQPIELVWARVKHEVATQSMLGRKWQETQEQTKIALKNVSSQLCTNIIGHTHKLMNEWLQTDTAGSLKKHGSLEALGLLTPAQRAKCTDLNVEDELRVGEAEEEKENRAAVE
jgi:transposase